MAQEQAAHILLQRPKLQIDRMPVLQSIFERLAQACTEGFRQLCVPPVTFFLNQVENKYSWDVLETYEDSIAAIIHCREWDSPLLIGVDRRFVFSLVEAAVGGDGSESPYDSDRPFSVFELNLAQKVLELAANSLQASFSAVVPTTFKIEKVESKLEFSALGPRNIPSVVTQLLFQVIDQGGRMFVLIPQSALYNMRAKLGQERSITSNSPDPGWARKMQSGVAKTEVTLQAVLEGRSMTLSEISNLKPGQVLALNSTPTSLVSLQSGDRQLFWCRLGQSDGHFTVAIDTPVSNKEETLEEIITTPPKKR
ncbi:MAG: flagellar motor switch protein FliM [Hyphomicrobiaceae bacterium]